MHTASTFPRARIDDRNLTKSAGHRDEVIRASCTSIVAYVYLWQEREDGGRGRGKGLNKRSVKFGVRINRVMRRGMIRRERGETV